MAVEEEQAQASTPDDNLTQAPKRPRGKAQDKARFSLIHWNELPEYLRVRFHVAKHSSTRKLPSTASTMLVRRRTPA